MTMMVADKMALQPYQRALYETFASSASCFVAVNWPPGAGVHFTAAQIAKQLSLADAEGRVLVIVPYRAVAEQLVQQLSHDGARVVFVDSYMFRELVDRAGQGSVPWEPHTVYVLVSPLLLRQNVARELSRSRWAFVIVSMDYVRLADSKTRHVLGELLSADRTPRVLWISATRENLEVLPIIPGANWDVRFLSVNDLRLAGDTNFRSVEFELFLYNLSDTEQAIESLIDKLSKVQDLKAYSEALRLLKNEWPSSGAALETAMRRLGRQLTGDQVQLTEDGAQDEELPGRISGLTSTDHAALTSFVQEALQKLEELDTDSKYRALLSVLGRLDGAKHMCVVTRYRATAAYLQAALQHSKWSVQSVHAGMSAADREQSIRQFSATGGVLVCTPLAMGTLPSLPRVGAVIFYDMPATSSLLRIVGSLRRGPATDALNVCALMRPDDFQTITRLSEATEAIRTQG